MELSILVHCDRRPQNSPQLAILTFDGAVNLNNMKYYDELLKLKGKVCNIFLIYLSRYLLDNIYLVCTTDYIV